MYIAKRRRVLQGGLAVAAGVLAAPAVHAKQRVSTALIFAADVSSTVTPPRFELQRDGQGYAVRHEQSIEIIEGLRDPIAVMAFYWANGQVVSVPWMILRTRADAELFGDCLVRSARPNFDTIGRYTYIGEALDFGCLQFSAQKFFRAERCVIDVSGDGDNSKESSRRVEDARDEAVAKGIVINGLPILAHTYPRAQPPQGLDKYYEKSVIGGQDAFMVVAKGFEDFRRAQRQKFVQEVA